MPASQACHLDSCCPCGRLGLGVYALPEDAPRSLEPFAATLCILALEARLWGCLDAACEVFVPASSRRSNTLRPGRGVPGWRQHLATLLGIEQQDALLALPLRHMLSKLCILRIPDAASESPRWKPYSAVRSATPPRWAVSQFLLLSPTRSHSCALADKSRTFMPAQTKTHIWPGLRKHASFKPSTEMHQPSCSTISLGSQPFDATTTLLMVRVVRSS